MTKVSNSLLIGKDMITETIMEKAKASRARIAIGADRGYEQKVIESARKAEELGYASVIIVSTNALETDIEHIVAPNAGKKMVELLRYGDVEGIVRGSVDINPVMAALKTHYSIEKLLRLAILKTPAGFPFLFAPVGIDDAWTFREKVKLGMLGADFLRKLGFKESIAVLGGGRAGDIGRSKITDKSIRDAEKVTGYLNKKGYTAKCAYILIEDAVGKDNFVLAPDGISGNLIYRSLCLVGEGTGMGGPAVGVDFVYVDTSRAGRTYHNAICCASALAGMKKN